MTFSGKRVVITGAGGGIGAAMARRWADAGAKLVLSDLDLGAVSTVADPLGAEAVVCDVRDERAIRRLVAEAGDIDIFVSNAGLGCGQGTHAASAPDDIWQVNWQVHVMAHVHAARALLPDWIARGHGHFVNVASAAGLLNQIGDAAYSATKHAAVSFAESLAISHGDNGIGVTVVCPQYVATPLIGLAEADAAGSLITADEVARVTLDAVAESRFRALPHPKVAEYFELRARDPEKWIAGMRALRRKAIAENGSDQPDLMYRLV